MKCVIRIILLAWLIRSHTASAQTVPFSSSWHFDGTDAGVSSNPLVAVSSVSFNGVNKLFGTYQTGYAGQGVSLQHWPTTTCNHDKYAEFTVQPQGTAQVTLLSLSFAFSRSDEGPQLISVRSSADGYSSDIFSQSASTTYQTAAITLSGSGFTNQSSAITFRIYGCNPVSSNGTLRLDEIAINGQTLPVTLVWFTAKPQGKQALLSWETTQERDADSFDIQRSYDLGEFITIGQVAAKGNTDQRNQYEFMDQRPLDNINYYRLKQVDRDGQTTFSNIVSVVMDDLEPSMEVVGNPIDGPMIRVAAHNNPDAAYTLTAQTGQTLAMKAEKQANGLWLLTADQPLASGVYLLRADGVGKRLIQKIIVP